jgi:RNA polymerase sigma-70 factor (ECF subfamily)
MMLVMQKKRSTTQETVEVSVEERDWVAEIQRIAAGSQEAMSELYDGTNRLVFGLILRILNDRTLAEEVMLDVYTQIWRQASRYDSLRGTPLGWITTIARSRAIDKRRAEHHFLEQSELNEAITGDTVVSFSPERATIASEISHRVKAALSNLSPEQRVVIELAYYGGFTQTEISAKLNLPLGTIKTRTRLAMLKLREMLKPVMATM